MKESLTFILVFCFVAFVACLETDVSLRGADRVRIISEFKSLPIAVATDDSVPEGTARITVGAGEFVNLDDISSRIKDDFVEIRITGSESYDSSNYSSNESTSSSTMLKPISSALLISLFLCFWKKPQMVFFALLLLATVYAHTEIEDQSIIITFSSQDNIQDIEIISPSSSVIVAPQLAKICLVGSDSDDFDDCISMICDINDDNCISSDLLHVGALLPFNADHGDEFLQALYLAANRYGVSVPGVQIIIVDSGVTVDSALNAARQLVSLGCEYFIGPNSSGPSLEVINYLESQKKEYSIISPDASSLELEKFDNFFSMYSGNDELVVAICQYAIYDLAPGAEIFRIYTLGVDNDYANDLISLLKTQCGPQVDVIEVGQYDALINSASDARDIVRSLNNALESDSNLALSMVLHVGFSDIKYVLESVQEEGGNAQKVPWFSTDATFDNSAVPSDVRDLASDLHLKGIQFIGYNVDSKIETRAGLLRYVFQETGEVSYAAVYVHDSAMLMYLTLEKMGSLLEEHSLFIPTIKQVSETTYGASGLLALNDEGFRAQNQFLIGGITNFTHDQLDSTWVAYQFLKTTGSRDTEFTQKRAFIDFVYYETLESIQKQCDNYIIEGQAYDNLGKPVNFRVTKDEVEDEDFSFYVPLFFDYTIDIICPESTFTLSCPPSATENVRACVGSLETKEKVFALVDCVVFGTGAAIAIGVGAAIAAAS